MKEIGELLQEARLEKGITLEQISKETKIPERMLRDLEEGNFSGFAGKVYLKGALRNYAEYIGIDSGELFSLYDRILEKDKPSSKEWLRSKNDEKETREGKMFVKKIRKPFPFVALIWIAVFVFVVGGSIWYRYEQGLVNGERVNYPGEVVVPEEPEENGENTIEVREPEPVEPPEEIEPEPVLQLISEDGRQATYVIREVESKEIILSFTGDCWISIEQDGNYIEQRTLRRGQTHRIGDARETTIRFGNPPAAGITVNGQSISLAGIGNPFNVTIRKE